MAALGSAVSQVSDVSSSTWFIAVSSFSCWSLVKSPCFTCSQNLLPVRLQVVPRIADAVPRDDSYGSCLLPAAVVVSSSTTAVTFYAVEPCGIAKRQSLMCHAVRNRNASPSEAADATSRAGPQVGCFQAVTAEITQQIGQLFASEAEGDPDQPSPGFASTGEAVEAIQKGKFVIAVDDEDRANEEDLMMVASLVSPEATAFMVKHGTGILGVGMKASKLGRLNLPLMVKDKQNEDAFRTAFTITVDLKAKVGTTTGVSASDIERTMQDLASRDSRPENFLRLFGRKQDGLVTVVDPLPTEWGSFRAVSYQSELHGIKHVATRKILCRDLQGHGQSRTRRALCFCHSTIASGVGDTEPDTESETESETDKQKRKEQKRKERKRKERMTRFGICLAILSVMALSNTRTLKLLVQPGIIEKIEVVSFCYRQQRRFNIPQMQKDIADLKKDIERMKQDMSKT